MKVFVAGASGVLGRQIVPRLVAAGHKVLAMTRSKPRAHPIYRAGAEPLVCNVFDRETLERAVGAFRPDVIVNQLTQIPRRLRTRRIDREMAPTNILRRDGTRILVELAEEVGARRIVTQSIAFAYAPSAAPLAVERDPLFLDAPAAFSGLIEAVRDGEQTVLEARGQEGVALRYGFFYGPGTAYALDGGMIADLARWRLPVIGDGQGRFSLVHIDDAADATVAAVAGGEAGIYNICDDEPVAAAEFLPWLAHLLDLRRPLTVPVWLGRLGGGDWAVHLMTALPGASNRHARTALGWTPGYASWRDGFRATLGDSRAGSTNS